MKKMNFSLALVTLFVASTSYLVAEEYNHHHEINTEKVSLDQGSKRTIDDSLHTGMSGIRNEVMSNLNAIHYNKFSDKQFAEIMPVLEKHLTYLF